MEIFGTQESKNNLEKEEQKKKKEEDEQSWRTHISWLKNLLLSYVNKKCVMM